MLKSICIFYFKSVRVCYFNIDLALSNKMGTIFLVIYIVRAIFVLISRKEGGAEF